MSLGGNPSRRPQKLRLIAWPAQISGKVTSQLTVNNTNEWSLYKHLPVVSVSKLNFQYPGPIC